MKRRTFILGGGLLATLSLGATATNASLADSIASAADFRVINEFEPTANLVANPSTPDTLSAHTWTTNDVTSDVDIDTIEVNYDFGSAEATFENVNSEDTASDPGDVIVELTRELSSGVDRSVINVNDDTYSGSSAVFDLSGAQTTNIVADPNNPNLSVKINADDPGAGIENPASADSYTPTLTLTNANGETVELAAELTLVSGQSFFATTITDVPATYAVNDPIQVDYEIDNTGDEANTQDIVLLVAGTQEDSTSVTLDPADPPATGSLSYTPTSSDGASIALTVESNDDSSSETITKGNTFTLSLNPDTAGATDAIHTWSADTVTESEFNDGEDIDTIAVDYSDSSQGSTLNNLDETDITVEMTRQLRSGPDRSTISVNDDNYSGDTATFDLSGFYTTDITNDPNNPDIVVTIGDSGSSTGAENPPQGSYTATITLNGENGSSVTDTVSYETT